MPRAKILGNKKRGANGGKTDMYEHGSPHRDRVAGIVHSILTATNDE